MKLSEYARRNNIRYLAAYTMWQKGRIEGHRLPTGTIFIHDSMPTADSPTKMSSGVALHARVSGNDQKDDALRQVRRLQRQVSQRAKGGANQKTAREQLARTDARVANIRRETLHQATTRLTKTKSIIVVENLNVSGMQKNHPLAAAIANVSWAEFKRQLKYKAA